jgi:N-methylhydantoinase A
MARTAALFRRASCREPITLVESGPVGGCIGAASYGHLLGVDNLVAFDMGGTTANAR